VSKKIPRQAALVPPSSWQWHRSLIWRNGLSPFDPARRLDGAPNKIEAEARKSGSVVTSVRVGGATTYIASGEIEVPRSALLS
jgi:hypothetical protein